MVSVKLYTKQLAQVLLNEKRVCSHQLNDFLGISSADSLNFLVRDTETSTDNYKYLAKSIISVHFLICSFIYDFI